jgi:hypothetical protein
MRAAAGISAMAEVLMTVGRTVEDTAAGTWAAMVAEAEGERGGGGGGGEGWLLLLGRKRMG